MKYWIMCYVMSRFVITKEKDELRIETCISLGIPSNQFTSGVWHASYSESAEDFETVFCFLVFHEMRLSLMKIQ